MKHYICGIKNHKIMRTKQFKLQNKDREFLENLTKTGKRNSKEFERAYILLALDKGKRHEEIVDFYNVSRITIWRVKNKYKKVGAQGAIKDELHPGQPPKYKEKEKAEIVALACTKAPTGRSRWTIGLLEKTLKQQEGMETINRETIRLTLKKMNVSLG
jgi:putative transposase